MTLADTIQIVDPAAKFHRWMTEGNCGWVAGTGWETKLTYSEARAWELAAEIVATRAFIQSAIEERKANEL